MQVSTAAVHLHSATAHASSSLGDLEQTSNSKHLEATQGHDPRHNGDSEHY